MGAFLNQETKRLLALGTLALCRLALCSRLFLGGCFLRRLPLGGGLLCRLALCSRLFRGYLFLGGLPLGSDFFLRRLALSGDFAFCWLTFFCWHSGHLLFLRTHVALRTTKHGRRVNRDVAKCNGATFTMKLYHVSTALRMFFYKKEYSFLCCVTKKREEIIFFQKRF